jgi:hypothetical protein
MMNRRFNGKVLIVLAGIGLVLFLLSGTLFADSGNSSVNWEQGVIRASGTGVPPNQALSPQQAAMMARRAAVVDAYRNLAEAIKGVRVNGETTVQNYAVANDEIHTNVAALVRGARITSERQFPDGSYRVTMEINLFGTGSLAQALRPSESVAPAALPQPSASYQNTAMPEYTGVIVDARGLGLQRCMSPLIYSQSGTIVYGNKYLDSNLVASQGMVDYAQTPADIFSAEEGQSRAGSLPIVVKAIAVRDHHCNVIISDEDADRILAANAQNDFLHTLAVVFEQ